MNDYIRDNLESGQACRQWFIDYAALIPGGSIFETKANAMKAKVDLLEDTAGQQESAEGAGLAATDVKSSEFDDLAAAMEPVRTAARAAEFDVPGTRDRYRFNRAMSSQDLLAAGRSFVDNGATDEDFLQGYGAADKWPDAIKVAADAFEASFALQDSAKGESVAKNAELKAIVKDMNRLKGALRHLVKNATIGNPGAYAAWKTAAHVKKSPSSPPPTP